MSTCVLLQEEGDSDKEGWEWMVYNLHKRNSLDNFVIAMYQVI